MLMLVRLFTLMSCAGRPSSAHSWVSKASIPNPIEGGEPVVVARNCLAVERAKKSLGQSTCNPRTAGRVVLSVASFGRRMPPSHRRRWAPGGAPCPPGPHKGAGQWWFRRLGNRSRHVGAEGVAGGTGAGGKSFTAPSHKRSGSRSPACTSAMILRANTSRTGSAWWRVERSDASASSNAMPIRRTVSSSNR
jgi:hypothetical protein